MMFKAMLHLLIFVTVCVATFVHSQPIDLPLFNNSCSRSSENYEGCLISAMEKSWPRISKGIPEFKIPPLDPLVMESISGNVQFGPIFSKFSISNSTLYGISDIKILSIDPKYENDHLHLELAVFHPKMFHEADYDFNSSISGLVLPMKGHMNFTITEVTVMHVVDGLVVEGRFKIENINTVLKIGDLKFWASDLFNGNKHITEMLVAFINQNWRVLYKSNLPVTQLFINVFIKDFVNEIISGIPILQAFPRR